MRPTQLTPMQKFLLAVSLPITLVFFYFLFRKNEDEDEEEEVVTGRYKTIEVKVPRDVIGVVIGLQGAQIKLIQDATKTRINFKDDFGSVEERTMVIRGRPDGVQKAELMVKQIIVDQPPTISEVIYVPKTAVGRIIGRNGDTIRNISRQSRAKVNVDRADSQGSREFVEIEIKGPPSTIMTAKGLIMEKVEEDREFRARTGKSLVGELYQEQKHAENYQGAPGKNKDVVKEREKLEDSDYMPVYVSAVENPGHFWVQMIGQESIQLEPLMNEMTKYYSDPVESSSTESGEFKVGDMVAAPVSYDTQWYRARVSDIQAGDVDLYYVDFGDSGIVPIKNIRKLRSDFLVLPYQAVECALADIEPNGDDWSESAIQTFEDLVYVAKWKVIMSKTVGYEETSAGTVPRLHMIDTNGSCDVEIAEELVQRGLAVRGTSSDLTSTEISLVNKISGDCFDKFEWNGASDAHLKKATASRHCHYIDYLPSGNCCQLDNSILETNLKSRDLTRFDRHNQNAILNSTSGRVVPMAVGPYESLCEHLSESSRFCLYDSCEDDLESFEISSIDKNLSLIDPNVTSNPCYSLQVDDHLRNPLQSILQEACKLETNLPCFLVESSVLEADTMQQRIVELETCPQFPAANIVEEICFSNRLPQEVCQPEMTVENSSVVSIQPETFGEVKLQLESQNEEMHFPFSKRQPEQFDKLEVIELNEQKQKTSSEMCEIQEMVNKITAKATDDALHEVFSTSPNVIMERKSILPDVEVHPTTQEAQKVGLKDIEVISLLPHQSNMVFCSDDHTEKRLVPSAPDLLLDDIHRSVNEVNNHQEMFSELKLEYARNEMCETRRIHVDSKVPEIDSSVDNNSVSFSVSQEHVEVESLQDTNIPYNKNENCLSNLSEKFPSIKILLDLNQLRQKLHVDSTHPDTVESLEPKTMKQLAVQALCENYSILRECFELGKSYGNALPRCNNMDDTCLECTEEIGKVKILNFNSDCLKKIALEYPSVAVLQNLNNLRENLLRINDPQREAIFYKNMNLNEILIFLSLQYPTLKESFIFASQKHNDPIETSADTDQKSAQQLFDTSNHEIYNAGLHALDKLETGQISKMLYQEKRSIDELVTYIEGDQHKMKIQHETTKPPHPTRRKNAHTAKQSVQLPTKDKIPPYCISNMTMHHLMMTPIDPGGDEIDQTVGTNDFIVVTKKKKVPTATLR